MTDFPIRFPRPELLALCRQMVEKVAARGVTIPDWHRCGGTHCLAMLVLGSGGWDCTGDDWLWGQNFTLYARWDLHEKRATEIYAYFAGPDGSGKSVDLPELLEIPLPPREKSGPRLG